MELDKVLAIGRALAKELNRLSELPGGEHLSARMKLRTRLRDGERVSRLELPSLQEMMADVSSVIPHTRCPYCCRGREVLLACDHCQGRNWVTKAVFNAAPSEVQSAVLELEHQDAELVGAQDNGGG